MKFQFSQENQKKLAEERRAEGARLSAERAAQAAQQRAESMKTEIYEALLNKINEKGLIPYNALLASFGTDPIKVGAAAKLLDTLFSTGIADSWTFTLNDGKKVVLITAAGAEVEKLEPPVVG